MKQATTRGLFEYWNTVRGTRMAPRRYEIEPSQIVPFLSETLILEHPHEDDCRIRVAGTRLCEWFGEDLRGQLFYSLWKEADQQVLRENIATITQYGGIGLFAFTGWRDDVEEEAEFEMLLLPLMHLTNNVERVLGAISTSQPPAWLATATPSRISLAHNEIIWPDGRPHAFVDRLERSVVVPRAKQDADIGLRHARIVRSDRRSFLVYDGGLSENSSAEER